jgi:hypothetical protein
MAASYSLKLLKERSELDRTILTQITSAIQNQLHPAAFVSLTHAVALMLACSEGCPAMEGGIIARSCLNYLDLIHRQILASGNGQASLSSWVQLPFLLCVLSLGRASDEPPSHKLIRLTAAMRILAESPARSEEYINSFLLIGITEVISHPEFYLIEDSFARTYPIPVQDLGDITHKAKLWAVKDVYQVAQTDSPALSIHLFILSVASRADQSQLGQLGFLSRFRLLRLSRGLLRQLKKTGLISRLLSGSNSSSHSQRRRPRRDLDGYLSGIQLWTFYALLGNLPSTAYTREQGELLEILQVSFQSASRVGRSKSRERPSIETRRQTLEGWILKSCVEFADQVGPLAIYSYRIVECILEAHQHLYQSLYKELSDRINQELRNVPQRLRGLSSFTPANVWVRTTPSDPRPSHVELTVVPPLQTPPKRRADISSAPRLERMSTMRDVSVVFKSTKPRLTNLWS